MGLHSCNMMHHRQSVRMKSWDYSESGAYFVTLCAHRRHTVFGEIRQGVMGLNRFGCLVWNEWYLLALRRPSLILDEFIVMPNHLHLILFLQNDVSMNPWLQDRDRTNKATAGSLGAVMGGFKSGVTREISRLRDEHTVVWQRLFYDRVIRDERELNAMRRYIHNNVINWPRDKHFPTP